MKKRTWSDRIAAIAALLSVSTTLLGIGGCGSRVETWQSPFVLFSVATIIFASLGVVANLFQNKVSRDMIWMGIGIIPLGVLWAFLLQDLRPENWHRTLLLWDAKDIALASHSYFDKNKWLPTDVRDGANRSLLSWRVRIAPYLDEGKPVFDQFDLTQSWDSPRNQPFVKNMPRQFRMPMEEDGSGLTHWQGFAGPGTAFEPGATLQFGRDFPDGTGNTIFFVEASQRVPWSKPADIAYGPNIPLPDLGNSHLQRGQWPFHNSFVQTRGFVACMADASVRYIGADISEETLRALIVRNDGKPDKDW